MFSHVFVNRVRWSMVQGRSSVGEWGNSCMEGLGQAVHGPRQVRLTDCWPIPRTIPPGHELLTHPAPDNELITCLLPDRELLTHSQLGLVWNDDRNGPWPVCQYEVFYIDLLSTQWWYATRLGGIQITFWISHLKTTFVQRVLCLKFKAITFINWWCFSEHGDSSSRL